MGRSKEVISCYNKAYYQRNREKELARQAKYKAANHDRALASTKTWKAKNPEWSKEYNITYYEAHSVELKTKQKARNRSKREAVLNYYGGRCACCGESQYEFLAIDHIEGGGRKHLEQIGQRIIDYLVKNNLPKGFQVLCHNCNMAKGLYGQCPHISNQLEGREALSLPLITNV